MRPIVHIPKIGKLRFFLSTFIFFTNLLKFLIKKFEKISFIFFDKIIFKKKNMNKINIISKNKKIIILGNSPNIDLKYLKDKKQHDILSLNFFYNSNLSKLIKPNYYMIIHRPYESHIFDKKKVKNFIKYVFDNPNIIFFLTKEWKKILGIKDNIYYFDQTISQITNYSINTLLKFEVFPAISNVMISACYIALKMKYKNIFIHGYDLNFPIYAKVPHHYDEIIKKNIYENFDQDAYKLIDLTLNEWLHLKKISQKNKSNIYSTRNTFLPIFKENNVL